MGRVLAMGDFGREDCGVGSSEAVVARRAGDVEVLDTSVPGLWRFARAARRLARRHPRMACVGVYPTRSTVYLPTLLVRALVLRAIFGRRFRLHLHEFRNLRKMLRWPLKLVLLLPARIVVTSLSEAEAVRSSWVGLVGRRVEVVVAPPTNGTAPSSEAVAKAATSPARTGVVGVFGMLRPDKDTAWLQAVLLQLPPHLTRLVVVGEGWQEQVWGEDLLRRFDVQLVGHVPTSELADLFATWDLAVAPLDRPVHDGRMSVRTPLAFGVPTVTVGPRTGDLTLVPDHLVIVAPGEPVHVEEALRLDRRTCAEQVAAIEEDVADALLGALFE